MAPPIASASMSGVGDFTTSIDSIELVDTLSISKPRFVPRVAAPASSVPSTATEFSAGSTPRTRTRKATLSE